MPVVVGMKSKDKYYLLADNSFNNGIANLSFENPSQYKIQKFKNFKVAYYGSKLSLFEFNKYINLDTLPNPLTYDYMLKEFYPKYLDFIKEYGYGEYAAEVLEYTNFELMIMGDNYLYDIGDEFVYEVNNLNAIGDDTLAFALYDFYSDKLKPMELLKLIMEKTSEMYTNARYPYIVTESGSNKYTIFFKDGTSKEEEFEEFFGGINE